MQFLVPVKRLLGTSFFYLLGFIYITLTIVASGCEAGEIDRIKRILDREKVIEYRKASSDGIANSFYATVRFEGGRTQTVVIVYRPVIHVDTRLIKILSVGYESDRDSIDPEIANQVLEWNGNMKWGSWGKQYNFLVMTLLVPLESQDETIRNAIYTVASSADSKEEELTGKDRF